MTLAALTIFTTIAALVTLSASAPCAEWIGVTQGIGNSFTNPNNKNCSISISSAVYSWELLFTITSFDASFNANSARCTGNRIVVTCVKAGLYGDTDIVVGEYCRANMPNYILTTGDEVIIEYIRVNTQQIDVFQIELDGDFIDRDDPLVTYNLDQLITVPNYPIWITSPNYPADARSGTAVQWLFISERRKINLTSIIEDIDIGGKTAAACTEGSLTFQADQVKATLCGSTADVTRLIRTSHTQLSVEYEVTARGVPRSSFRARITNQVFPDCTHNEQVTNNVLSGCQGSGPYVPYTVCNYRCKTDSNINGQVTCLLNGTWSTPLNVCPAPTTAGVPMSTTIPTTTTTTAMTTVTTTTTATTMTTTTTMQPEMTSQIIEEITTATTAPVPMFSETSTTMMQTEETPDKTNEATNEPMTSVTTIVDPPAGTSSVETKPAIVTTEPVPTSSTPSTPATTTTKTSTSTTKKPQPTTTPTTIPSDVIPALKNKTATAPLAVVTLDLKIPITGDCPSRFTLPTNATPQEAAVYLQVKILTSLKGLQVEVSAASCEKPTRNLNSLPLRLSRAETDSNVITLKTTLKLVELSEENTNIHEKLRADLTKIGTVTDPLFSTVVDKSKLNATIVASVDNIKITSGLNQSTLECPGGFDFEKRPGQIPGIICAHKCKELRDSPYCNRHGTCFPIANGDPFCTCHREGGRRYMGKQCESHEFYLDPLYYTVAIPCVALALILLSVCMFCLCIRHRKKQETNEKMKMHYRGDMQYSMAQRPSYSPRALHGDPYD